jgi:hypothetical protein
MIAGIDTAVDRMEAAVAVSIAGWHHVRGVAACVLGDDLQNVGPGIVAGRGGLLFIWADDGVEALGFLLPGSLVLVGSLLLAGAFWCLTAWWSKASAARLGEALCEEWRALALRCSR